MVFICRPGRLLDSLASLACYKEIKACMRTCGLGMLVWHGLRSEVARVRFSVVVALRQLDPASPRFCVRFRS